MRKTLQIVMCLAVMGVATPVIAADKDDVESLNKTVVSTELEKKIEAEKKEKEAEAIADEELDEDGFYAPCRKFTDPEIYARCYHRREEIKKMMTENSVSIQYKKEGQETRAEREARLKREAILAAEKEERRIEAERRRKIKEAALRKLEESDSMVQSIDELRSQLVRRKQLEELTKDTKPKKEEKLDLIEFQGTP